MNWNAYHNRRPAGMAWLQVEIVDMDNNRIDKVLVYKPEKKS
jgi:CBS domain containing-hemolysin-like protein